MSTVSKNSSVKQGDFPIEILGKMKAFHQSLEKVKQVLEPLAQLNINSPDINLSPLDRARLNVTSGYALNSLFWMYLSTVGIDPKIHGVREELNRYKSYMVKIKEIDDKKFAPRLDKGAAGRFVKGALWNPKQKQNDEEEEVEKGEQEEEQNSPSSKRTLSGCDNKHFKRIKK